MQTVSQVLYQGVLGVLFLIKMGYHGRVPRKTPFLKDKLTKQELSKKLFCVDESHCFRGGFHLDKWNKITAFTK